ncbi:MAG: asparagine synthase (glutamine-hydrolyzing) [Lachnospiraceae bacterium]|nr:asparagine synthase (glutamine-hydrolyzing) [Lachnospiraceae bacterium]
MCGIAGFCNRPANWQDEINAMNERMILRGPDAGGSWISVKQDVVFGHRRLSIVDLSENGAQPMVSKSGRYVICYNGEIYNYQILRDKMLEEGKITAFRGTSDTEVLLEAFEAYGITETIKQCKGMFAIALYDQKEEKLYLMRDRVGEKPLYYGFVKNSDGSKSFVFASDLGCIQTLQGFDNKINTKILNIYFVHGYIPAPYSIYEDIYKLEPGTILEMSAPYQEYKITPYWSMTEAAVNGQKNQFKGTETEAADELERLLKESLKGQMVADVPVGAFLSAGIDSSTIVALMQSLSNQKVRSFTIGMEDKAFNEAVYAKEIANHIGTEHTELYITEQDAKAVIPKLAHMFAEPFADSSQIPTYLVSKMTREHVTVSLSGDGGDELFCGYEMYNSVSRIWGKMGKIPYFIRKPASEMLVHSPFMKSKVQQTKSMLLGAKNPAELYELDNREEPLALKISLDHTMAPYKHNQYQYGAIEEINHNIMLMDMTMYHPDDILVKVDRTAMAVSLETRVPMLDKDVVEFAWSLPIDYKKKDGVSKRVLRDVLYRYVPKEMMERPKKGFSIPISKWLKEPELRGWAESLIDRKTLEQQNVLDSDVVWFIWKDYIENDVWRIQVWYILMFQEWMCSL